MKKETQKVLFKTRAEFREWLTENAETSDGIWLIFGKTKVVASMSAAEALEEALCFGWIDGLMERVDENSYIKYFKQRAKASNWSEKNKKLVEKLESDGMMTDLGRAKIKYAKQCGKWNANKKSEPLSDEAYEQFYDIIKPFKTAYANLMMMSPSVRRNYANSYFLGAKTTEGKQKRLDTIIKRLDLNLDPMQSMKKALERLEKDQIQ